MTLEQLAREVGVLQSDRTAPCVQSHRTPPSQPLAERDENQCIVDLLGYEINTSSFTLYSFSLAIILQTLVLISIGAIADYGITQPRHIDCCCPDLTPRVGRNRKRLLLALSSIGATACMLFVFVYSGIILAGLLLTMVSVASLGSSFVLLNSFLPLLVANHPSIRKEPGFESVPLGDVVPNIDDEDILDDQDPSGENLETNELINGLLRQKLPIVSDKVSPTSKLSNYVSSKGIGIGYAASVLVQCIGIAIIVIYSKIQAAGWDFPSTMPLRTVLFFVGLWWASFTIPTALWLRHRPGPPLPWNVGETKSRRSIPVGLRYMIFAWVSLWRTIKIALKLPEVLKFLLGWFLLSDGIATIMGTSILFARTELQLSSTTVALLSITATASGIVGTIFWPILGRRFGLTSIFIVLSCIFLFELIPLYGLLGFIPFIRSLGFIGLQQWWEIYPLGFLLGIVMGGISSYCRSIFGSLIPPGMEAAFYALYAVTDKGSSVIGPAVVGRIIDVTGSIRMGFWFLAFLMISPAPFFWFVDLEKGRLEGQKLARRPVSLRGEHGEPAPR